MVKLRLARRGRKKLALYDIIVADARAPRDGKFIEKIGAYNPNSNPATILLDEDKALDWLIKGAQPTDTVRAMLSYKGVLFRKHLQVGVNKGAITQEVADERFTKWKAGKEGKVETKIDTLASNKKKAAEARAAAESQVRVAREKAAIAKATPPPAPVETEEAAVDAPEHTQETTQETAE